MLKKENQVSNKYKPKVGEKVVCTHVNKVYEAKVLSVRDKEHIQGEREFFVHYQGWSKNWDEWVSEERIAKWSENSDALIKESKKAALPKGKSSAKKNRGSTTSLNVSTVSIGPTSQIEEKEPKIEKVEKVDKEIKEKRTSLQGPKVVPPPTPITKKSKGDSIFEDLELKRTKPEVKIKLPDELKNYLLDDENNIKNKKLFLIPSRPTISTLLKDYINYRKTSTKLVADKEVSLNEFTLGLKHSFNIMVGAHLLYKFERVQYLNILKEYGKEADLTLHYGAIHLLRMITKIGTLMAFTTLDSRDIQTLLNHISEFLKYIKKQNNLFDVDNHYQIAPPEYIRQLQRGTDC